MRSETGRTGRSVQNTQREAINGWVPRWQLLYMQMQVLHFPWGHMVEKGLILWKGLDVRCWLNERISFGWGSPIQKDKNGQDTFDQWMLVVGHNIIDFTFSNKGKLYNII